MDSAELDGRRQEGSAKVPVQEERSVPLINIIRAPNTRTYLMESESSPARSQNDDRDG